MRFTLVKNCSGVVSPIQTRISRPHILEETYILDTHACIELYNGSRTRTIENKELLSVEPGFVTKLKPVNKKLQSARMNRFNWSRNLFLYFAKNFHKMFMLIQFGINKISPIRSFNTNNCTQFYRSETNIRLV